MRQRILFHFLEGRRSSATVRSVVQDLHETLEIQGAIDTGPEIVHGLDMMRPGDELVIRVKEG
jgi:hypothetical protein